MSVGEQGVPPPIDGGTAGTGTGEGGDAPPTTRSAQ